LKTNVTPTTATKAARIIGLTMFNSTSVFNHHIMMKAAPRAMAMAMPMPSDTSSIFIGRCRQHRDRAVEVGRTVQATTGARDALTST
jgi:hypothetical protein